MKQLKKLGLILGISLLSLQLVGCNASQTSAHPPTNEAAITFEKLYDEEALDSFMNAGGTFSIDLPTEWLQDASANPDSLITATDENMGLSVMITKYTKDSPLLKEMKGEGIDAFVTLYEEKGIPKLLEMVTPSPLETINLDHFPIARGYEMSFHVDDINNKAYYAYVEGESAFYAISISGKSDLYDENISKLKGTLNTFKEFALPPRD